MNARDRRLLARGLASDLGKLAEAYADALVHAYQGRDTSPVSAETVAAGIVRRLQHQLAIAEQLAGDPPSPDSLALEILSFARGCAQMSADLHQAAAALDPAAVVEALTESEG